MSCGMCIGGYDYDGPVEFSRVETPKARKPHRCEECGRVIQRGEYYQLSVQKFDGDFSAVKTCLLCAEISAGFNCEDGAILVGELWSELRDIVFPQFSQACLDKLETAAAKAFLVDRWRRWKGLAA